MKSEPGDPSKSFLELEARSRRPHNEHKWNLKVKTSPPNHLVSGGGFASGADKAKTGATAFRIPKLISDLKFVDYELQIDKVSTNLTSNHQSKRNSNLSTFFRFFR